MCETTDRRYSKHVDIPDVTQTWIEPETLGALRLGSDDRVLSLAAGGDLALAACRVASVVHVASSPADLALVALKIAGARELPVEGLRCMLGVDPGGRRVFLYHLMRGALSPPARTWWDAHESLIRTGVLRSGRFESWLESHRGLTRALVATGVPPVGRLRRRLAARPDAPLGRWIVDGVWRTLDEGPPYLTPAGHANLREASARVELVLARPAEWLAAQPPGRFTAITLGPGADASTRAAVLGHGRSGARLLRPLWRSADATEVAGWTRDRAAEAEMEPLALWYARCELLRRS